MSDSIEPKWGDKVRVTNPARGTYKRTGHVVEVNGKNELRIARVYIRRDGEYLYFINEIEVVQPNAQT